jgi:hypothetical protein
MAFFASDNPIALFLALVVVISVLKIWLSKRKWFAGKKEAYMLPILIVLVIFLIAYRPLLSMISYGLPYFIMVVVFLFALGAIMFVLGMRKDKIWPELKDVGPLRIAVYIFIFCIIALSISHVYGDKLLQDKSVSLTDATTSSQEPVEIDFSPIFTKQVLGTIFVFIVLGFVFVCVNFSQ